MGLFLDIATLVGGSYATKHVLDNGTEVPINLASSSVLSLSSVRDLLPVTLDINEVDIELTKGSTVSCYGSEAELTFVSLAEIDGTYWVSAFEYENIDDYNVGVALQTPTTEARV